MRGELEKPQIGVSSFVSAAAFREQMEFLKANYRVVPLADGVKSLNTRGTAERLVAVTFADGYLDNAAAAARACASSTCRPRSLCRPT